MATAMQRWGLAHVKKDDECFICPCHLGVHVRTHGVLDHPYELCVTFWLAWLYCCLTHSCCVEVTQWWGLVHGEKYGESISSCPCRPSASYIMWCAANVQHIHIGPCVTYLLDWFTELLPGSQFLCGACVCTFCVTFCGLKAQYSDDSHVHATAPWSVCVWFRSHSPHKVMHSSSNVIRYLISTCFCCCQLWGAHAQWNPFLLSLRHSHVIMYGLSILQAIKAGHIMATATAQWTCDGYEHPLDADPYNPVFFGFVC